MQTLISSPFYLDSFLKFWAQDYYLLNFLHLGSFLVTFLAISLIELERLNFKVDLVGSVFSLYDAVNHAEVYLLVFHVPHVT
jgi:hypothetical protein